jgi:hypothetical protein
VDPDHGHARGQHDRGPVLDVAHEVLDEHHHGVAPSRRVPTMLLVLVFSPAVRVGVELKGVSWR